MLFTLKIYSFDPKIAFKSFLYYESCKKFRKNQFFSNIFTFLSVIRKNFEYSLRILANFGNFHVITQKFMDFAHTFSKNYRFFLYFLIKFIHLVSKHFLQQKMQKVS